MIHCMTLWSYKQFKMFSAMTFTFFRVIRFRIAFCFDLQKSRSSKVRTECLRLCKKRTEEISKEAKETHAIIDKISDLYFERYIVASFAECVVCALFFITTMIHGLTLWFVSKLGHICVLRHHVLCWLFST